MLNLPLLGCSSVLNSLVFWQGRRSIEHVLPPRGLQLCIVIISALSMPDYPVPEIPYSCSCNLRIAA
jgi:hypothetical protein